VFRDSLFLGEINNRLPLEPQFKIAPQLSPGFSFGLSFILPALFYNFVFRRRQFLSSLLIGYDRHLFFISRFFILNFDFCFRQFPPLCSQPFFPVILLGHRHLFLYGLKINGLKPFVSKPLFLPLKFPL